MIKHEGTDGQLGVAPDRHRLGRGNKLSRDIDSVFEKGDLSFLLVKLEIDEVALERFFFFDHVEFGKQHLSNFGGGQAEVGEVVLQNRIEVFLGLRLEVVELQNVVQKLLKGVYRSFCDQLFESLALRLQLAHIITLEL